MECAEKMIGRRLITKQTGASGKPCDKVCFLFLYYSKQIHYKLNIR